MSTFIPDTDYKKCLRYLPVCTVDLILLNPTKNKVLLFRRKNKPLRDHFYFPGGRIFKRETVEQAALRVAQEELGLKLNRRQLKFGGYLEEMFNESIYKGVDSHYLNLFFGVTVKEATKIILDGQHTDCRWFPISDRHLHKNIKKKLKKWGAIDKKAR